MKIAYFGYNSLSSCLPIFEKMGHEISVIYTGNDALYADQVMEFSVKNKIPTIFSKPNLQQMLDLLGNGVDLFFAAEYPWRIPIPNKLRYAINVHPTLLPFGRGPTPLSYMLLKEESHLGVTLHKMTDKIDEGDIILQRPIELNGIDSYDTCTAKIFIEAPLLLSQLLASFEKYYFNAKPQKQGTYWPSLTREDQTINWNCSVQQLARQHRAFGRLGVFTKINNMPVLISTMETAVQNHSFVPGSILINDHTQLVIAASNGIVSVSKAAITII